MFKLPSSRPETFGDDGSSMSTNNPYAWRSDPTESLSDWTILVRRKSEPNRIIDTYHVHKVHLVTGLHRSSYFRAVFNATEKHMVSEKETSTTTLDLEDSAAQRFPDLLDLLYSSNHDAVKTFAFFVDWRGPTLVGLRHLCDYLGIPTLHQKVSNLIWVVLEESLAGDTDADGSSGTAGDVVFLDTMKDFVEEALRYNDFELVDKCVELTGTRHESVVNMLLKNQDGNDDPLNQEEEEEEDHQSPLEGLLSILPPKQQSNLYKYALQSSSNAKRKLETDLVELGKECKRLKAKLKQKKKTTGTSSSRRPYRPREDDSVFLADSD